MRLVLVFLAIFVSETAFAGGYQGEIDKFFRLYEKGEVLKAVDSIYSTNPWMTKESDAIQNIKNQLVGIGKLVGSYNGKENVDENNIADRFIHITYLVLYDRQPLRMEFQFYKPKKDWIIYSFSFDDKIDDEVQIASRKKIAQGMK